MQPGLCAGHRGNAPAKGGSKAIEATARIGSGAATGEEDDPAIKERGAAMVQHMGEVAR